ncbi:MAG: hypothetical protein O7C01_05095 [Actinobacteria bacterium]|nr:hypothetical protein [Actinomycetota bacterium]
MVEVTVDPVVEYLSGVGVGYRPPPFDGYENPPTGFQTLVSPVRI